MSKIQTFSEGIQGHVENYGDPIIVDTFDTSPVQRNRMYGQYMLVATGPGLAEGYKRIKDKWNKTQENVDEITGRFFNNKSITKAEEEILKTGWPKVFKKL